MRTKFNVILTLMLALVVQVTFAQNKVITGVVTEAGTGEPLPGVNIVVKGTNTGATTDFDGKYTIKADKGQTLVFSYVGYSTVEKKVGDANVINVEMKEGTKLEAVVITGAQGIKEKPKEITYAQQVVKSSDLSIGKDTNLKTALSGKVAGVQVHAQAGSKLGETGKVYLRGAISAKGRQEALYIVDGVETSADNVDMDNVESINVLKGPAAIALYGLRGADGVILITTKGGKKGKISVELYNNTTFDKVSYLPNYQNEYGQGYAGEAEWLTYDHASFPLASSYPEWSALDGVNYIKRTWVDESWGPKFDGRDYAPWYAWWQGENGDNPYFGKTQKYVAQPDNIKNFYDTGINSKTGFAISGGTDKATARVSYSNNQLSGIIPTTSLSQDIFSAKFKVKVTDKFSIGVDGIFSKKTVEGGTDFDDSYANQISGSFNQWFGRQLEIDKLKELKNLKTKNGYTASWNNWSPFYMQYAGIWIIPDAPDVEKPVFWFNPYWFLEQEEYTRDYNRYLGKINLEYKVSDDLKLNFDVSRNSTTFQYGRKTYYSLQYNSNALSNGFTEFLNSMRNYKSVYTVDEFHIMGDYKTNITKDLKLGYILGLNGRFRNYNTVDNDMTREGKPTAAGFVIPDLFNFANSKEVITPETTRKDFKNYVLFNRLKLSYKDFLFFTGDLSNTWDSRYDLIGRDNDNSFMYGSAGLSFVFTNAFELPEFLNYGKIRVNYAAVGTEVEPNYLNPGYDIDDAKYGGLPLMYTPEIIVDPNVRPATSSAYEIGFDTRMLKNRLTFSLTYFDEHRTDEILKTEVPYSTGARYLMTNAGDVHRTGVEVELGATPIKTDNFKWDFSINFSNPYVKVLELAPGQDSQLLSWSSFGVVSVLNIPGKQYGQIQGTMIKRDDNGNPILIENIDQTTGEVSYVYDKVAGQNFGSILPDFSGGIINKFSYKGFDLSATISYQKGGKFFSLTEWWGTYTGLLEETAGLNDKGNPKRDDYTDGGGVHVTGVLNDGTPVDAYTNAHGWYAQQYPDLAEGFVHDADYIKLSEVSLTYNFPKKILGKRIKAAKIGVVARNLGLLAVAKDNKHNWDPSEFGYMFGDDAQLPGTRSFGFNVFLSL